MATTQEIGGIGHSVRRKEDARFIRGKGTYFDDITLPGMLYMEILRSPFATPDSKASTPRGHRSSTVSSRS